MNKYKTLILDNISIRKIVSMKDAIIAVERAFRFFGEGKVEMPPKLYIHLDKYNGDFRAMPAYIEGFRCCAIKWVNVHPENTRIGLPTVMAIIILSDVENGLPLCIMDGTHLTALRTGAAGGIAAKYLARKDSKIVGMVGCGVQAKTQLLALDELFDIEKVRVWGFGPTGIRNFIKELSYLTGLRIESENTIRDCVRDCDIVVTTTPSRKPLVKLEWLKEGVHINAIGADAKGKQELNSAILKKAKIVVDELEQASHSGEINIPLKKKEISKKDIYADIGEIVAKKKKGRTSEKEITVFDSTGLAIQDLAMADSIYRKARKLKKGRYIGFGKH